MAIHTSLSAEEWEALASATFVPLRVRSALDTFTSTMDHQGDHRWGITSIRGDECRVIRSRDLLSDSPDDMVLFSLQVRGTSRVEQAGRQARVVAGDGVLYLTRSEYELTFPEAGELAVLHVPSERLGLRPESLSALAARPMRIRRDPALRTFARVVRSLFTTRPVIADPELAIRVASETLSAALHPRRGVSARERSHTALYAALERIIHERLEDPRLDVAELAGAENVSVRIVHQVFAERGTTPAAQIRQARMQRAMRLLESTDLPLADVALRCGCSDSSTFSRTFRGYAGQTPSEYRRRTAHISAPSDTGGR